MRTQERWIGSAAALLLAVGGLTACSSDSAPLADSDVELAAKPTPQPTEFVEVPSPPVEVVPEACTLAITFAELAMGEALGHMEEQLNLLHGVLTATDVDHIDVDTLTGALVEVHAYDVTIDMDAMHGFNTAFLDAAADCKAARSGGAA